MYASVGALFFQAACIAMDASDGEVENVVESNCTISQCQRTLSTRESVTRARKFERSIIE
jgi:hypothetical protein